MTSYDYVIVGAGSAGCVLANRLSADGSRVLLLEAGGSDRRFTVRAPLTFSGQFQGATDWNYLSESEPGLHGRRLQLPRGKVLGGTSSMNAMIYFRGDPSDFDGWASRHGATGWSYREVLPYFKRSEQNRDFSDQYHGTSGELVVSHRLRWRSSHYQDFIESAKSVGIRPNADFNGERADGVGLLQATIKDGRRWSSADAFLRPAMRRANLDVVTRAHVHKIELSGNRATGVQYARGTKMHRVRAEREVIVSAGAYASPQLLMLSGIGPADHLAEMGIPVAVDSPHVGQHLQEHPMVFMSWHAENCTTVDDAGPRDLAQWALNRSGKFSTNLIEAAVHWTSEPGLTAPDFQILFIPGFFWDGGYRKTGHPGVTTLVSYLAPESRGSVSLQSTDPTVHPRIFSNILGRQSEMDALVRAVELIRDITSRSPLRNIIKEEIQPSAAVDSRTALADWLRSIAEHTYHPTCTCRMGPPDEGVVDPQLRVYGVDNLRVADASIMPRITSGNTHAPAVMIGERCADFVLGKAPLAAPADPAVMGGVA